MYLTTISKKLSKSMDITILSYKKFFLNISYSQKGFSCHDGWILFFFNISPNSWNVKGLKAYIQVKISITSLPLPLAVITLQSTLQQTNNIYRFMPWIFCSLVYLQVIKYLDEMLIKCGEKYFKYYSYGS